jgi:hypothetical protein
MVCAYQQTPTCTTHVHSHWPSRISQWFSCKYMHSCSGGVMTCDGHSACQHWLMQHPHCTRSVTTAATQTPSCIVLCRCCWRSAQARLTLTCEARAPLFLVSQGDDLDIFQPATPSATSLTQLQQQPLALSGVSLIHVGPAHSQCSQYNGRRACVKWFLTLGAGTNPCGSPQLQYASCLMIRTRTHAPTHVHTSV